MRFATCAIAHHIMRSRVDLVLGTSLGGGGRHVRALARALAAGDTDVRVHGPSATEETFAFRNVGAQFSPTEVPSRLRPLRAWRAVRALRPQLAGAEIVHAHGVRAGLVAHRAMAANQPRPC